MARRRGATSGLELPDWMTDPAAIDDRTPEGLGAFLAHLRRVHAWCAEQGLEMADLPDVPTVGESA